MIKSRLIAILLSGLLTIGAGSLFITSSNNNEPKVNDITPNNAELSKNNPNSDTEKNNDKENNDTNINNESADINPNTDVTPNIQDSPDIQEQKEIPNNSSNENTTPPASIPEENLTIPSNNDSNNLENNINNTLPKPTTPDNYINEIEQAIFQIVNQERTAAGLPELSYSTTMEYYARLKSKDMGERNYFDHTNPEGNLITSEMKADGITYNAWGENIAYVSGGSNNYELAKQFMNNWMNSQGHRANILSSNFSSIGIGVYKVGNAYYATQEFYR